jgi:hypothetical protein
LRPRTEPFFQALGSAGRSSIFPAWLWSSISATAAVRPRLPSISHLAAPGEWVALS